ncbi:hypothetical protein SPAB_00039 [Salmonella enterica subsp. enterica serovar Paratyphi B str. SPB7]|uniref:Uncharacterized protein n=1 Tax=Salmonella paratyphi B (strain ATCC BAA-1250 / SPB7) TaxID=1016998 RepID=A0A6C6YWQ0_SALPB|nr:hypothetical protein SPAB_00039 [Salmonella enterica subsp. enterica serovar Paratyphi B str. SPB7]
MLLCYCFCVLSISMLILFYQYLMRYAYNVSFKDSQTMFLSGK